MTVEEPTDHIRDWFGAEIKKDESIEFLLETIGPVDKEMRLLIYDLYTYYGSNGSRTFIVFKYDFDEEAIVSYFVLPHAIFEKMWRFLSEEYDLWNEVEQIPTKDPHAVSSRGHLGEWCTNGKSSESE